MAAIPSFNIAPGESSDAASARRKIAMAMMMQGMDTSPVRHWAQGAGRLAQSLTGGYELYREDEKAKTEDAGLSSALVAALGQKPSAATVSPAPAMPTPSRGVPMAAIDPGSLTSPQSAPQKYVYSADEQSPLDPVPGAMTPNMQRLASAIYAGESGGRPNVMYGGKTFDSYADHPRVANPIMSGPNAGNVSTAAGAGQFIAPTWDKAKSALNLQDFSPGNQNAATAYTATEDFRKRTGGDLEAAMTQAGNDPTKLGAIAKALAPTWTSLPGGIEQNAAGSKFAQNAVMPTNAPISEASSQSRPQPTPQAQPAADPKTAQVREMLASPNAKVRKLGQSLALGVLQQNMKPETTDEIKEYNLYSKQEQAAGRQPKSFFDFKADLKKAGAINNNVNVGGGSDKQIFDSMDTSTNAARTAAAGLAGIREARAAVQSGGFFGAGANEMLGLQKVGAALGVANSDKIVNTETFRAAISPQVAAVLKATVGTANISNTDREFAERAAGGNITLDEKSISRLLDIMERAGSGIVTQHQKRLEKVYPDAEKYARERALFDVGLPEAPAITPTQAPARAAPDRAAVEQELRRRGLLK